MVNIGHEAKLFSIHIDRQEFRVAGPTITGQQLRDLTTPPIADNRDLYEEASGGDDPLIAKSDVVTLREGLHFFTAPSKINPGS
jgi:Multiubiquitin